MNLGRRVAVSKPHHARNSVTWKVCTNTVFFCSTVVTKVTFTHATVKLSRSLMTLSCFSTKLSTGKHTAAQVLLVHKQTHLQASPPTAACSRELTASLWKLSTGELMTPACMKGFDISVQAPTDWCLQSVTRCHQNWHYFISRLPELLKICTPGRP